MPLLDKQSDSLIPKSEYSANDHFTDEEDA